MILSLMIANNAAAAIVFPIAATVAVNVRAALAAPQSLGNGRHWQGALAGCAVSAAQLSAIAPSSPHSTCTLPVQDNIDIYVLAYAVMLGASAVFASSFGYQVCACVVSTDESLQPHRCRCRLHPSESKF